MGLSFTLAIQALANMAVGVNLIPVTGVTLPLVSMGGSSFLFTCASIGIILSVARNIEQSEASGAVTIENGNEPNVSMIEVGDTSNKRLVKM
jgi:cell division protein FtsW